jgi:predicted transporter
MTTHEETMRILIGVTIGIVVLCFGIYYITTVVIFPTITKHYPVWTTVLSNPERYFIIILPSLLVSITYMLYILYSTLN